MSAIQRVCFVLQVKPERLEEYRERHAHVWPEMLDALRESGWRNYTLFLHPTGQLIGYVETDNFEESLRLMASREVNDRWQREMQPFFVAPEGRNADELMTPLQEIFHLP